MKRRFCFILLIIMSTLLFSNSFFRERYFELKVDIPMNVSTNTLKIMDFLKKEVEILRFTQDDKYAIWPMAG